MKRIAFETVVVPSISNVDFSDMTMPMITIYDHPSDYPDVYVGRIWEIGRPGTNGPTNIVITRPSLQELRDDIMQNGFTVGFADAQDDACIVESWIR